MPTNCNLNKKGVHCTGNRWNLLFRHNCTVESGDNISNHIFTSIYLELPVNWLWIIGFQKAEKHSIPSELSKQIFDTLKGFYFYPTTANSKEKIIFLYVPLLNWFEWINLSNQSIFNSNLSDISYINFIRIFNVFGLYFFKVFIVFQ